MPTDVTWGQWMCGYRYSLRSDGASVYVSVDSCSDSGSQRAYVYVSIGLCYIRGGHECRNMQRTEEGVVYGETDMYRGHWSLECRCWQGQTEVMDMRLQLHIKTCVAWLKC